MSSTQPGILAPVPSLARYLEFAAVPDQNPTPILSALASPKMAETVVVGFGSRFATIDLKGFVRSLPSMDRVSKFPQRKLLVLDQGRRPVSDNSRHSLVRHGPHNKRD